jgi:hypothetical protein
MSTEAVGLPAGLTEVSRLAALLADRVLDAQITSRPVPDGNIRVLLEAALLLREYDQELPSLLSQIMHGAAAPEVPALVEVQQSAQEGESEAGRMAWLLRPFQASKG